MGISGISTFLETGIRRRVEGSRLCDTTGNEMLRRLWTGWTATVWMVETSECPVRCTHVPSTATTTGDSADGATADEGGLDLARVPAPDPHDAGGLARAAGHPVTDAGLAPGPGPETVLLGPPRDPGPGPDPRVDPNQDPDPGPVKIPAPSPSPNLDPSPSPDPSPSLDPSLKAAQSRGPSPSQSRDRSRDQSPDRDQSQINRNKGKLVQSEAISAGGLQSAQVFSTSCSTYHNCGCVAYLI